MNRPLITPLLFGMLCLLALGLCFGSTASAGPLRYTAKPALSQELLLDVLNTKRGDDALVLYTPEYGASTRSNAFGVEVQLLPVNPAVNQYEVVQMRSVWDCQKNNDMTACGNMPIPSNGFVLSASGRWRDPVFTQFLPGTLVELKPQYHYESSRAVQAIDPTEESNIAGKGFPGFRGNNQLLVYTRNYPDLKTGTNEFGHEVTVCGERVVAQEGSNSRIRESEDCYVLSGHGQARDWLTKYAPMGAQASLDAANKSVSLSIDGETYFVETKTLMNDIERISGKSPPLPLTQKMSELEFSKLRSGIEGPSDAVLADVLKLQSQLKQLAWAAYPPVFRSVTLPQEGIRGVWHRPKENTTAAIRETIARYKSAGLNTIFLETYLHGQPIFPSTAMKKHGIVQDPLPFGWVDNTLNPLTVWTEEAHRQGLKVHAWFQTFYAGNVRTEKKGGPILQAHPDWANVQLSSVNKTEATPSTVEAGYYFLDPANPDAKNYLLDLIQEIVTVYPVDGFQLDYIRYPATLPLDRSGAYATTWGYTPQARREFARRYAEVRALRSVLQAQEKRKEEDAELKAAIAKGLKKLPVVKTDVPDKVTLVDKLIPFYDPVKVDAKSDKDAAAAWHLYKTEQVDIFVQKTAIMLRDLRPGLVISAAVFPDETESLARKHQNWKRWLTESWLDAVAPMTLTNATATIEEETRRMEAVSSKPVLTGIFGPFNGSETSDVLDQVYAAARAGAEGIILFEGSHLTDTMLKALGSGLFR